MSLTAYEIERAVLSACLYDPSILRWLELDAVHFADHRNAAVWQAMQAVTADDIAADVVVLESALRRMEKLDAVGGLSYLAQLAECGFTAANVEHYAKKLRVALMSRRAVDLSGEIQRWVERGVEGEELLDLLSNAVSNLEGTRHERGKLIRELVRDEWRALERRLEAADRGEPIYPAVPTGIAALDRLSGGLPRGVPSLLAGRPGMGKSSVALQFARNAVARGHGVHWFSNEDPPERFARRWIANESSVPVTAFEQLAFKRKHFENLNYAMPRLLRQEGLVFEYCKGEGARWICRRVQSEAQRNKTQVVIVDMVHKIAGPAGSLRLHERIEQNTAVLDAGIGRLDVALLLVAHMNREHERDHDDENGGAPKLGKIAGSDSLGKDCKFVMVAEEPRHKRSGVDLWVIKHNQGPKNELVRLGGDLAVCRLEGIDQ